MYQHAVAQSDANNELSRQIHRIVGAVTPAYGWGPKGQHYLSEATADTVRQFLDSLIPEQEQLPQSGPQR